MSAERTRAFEALLRYFDAKTPEARDAALDDYRNAWNRIPRLTQWWLNLRWTLFVWRTPVLRRALRRNRHA